MGPRLWSNGAVELRGQMVLSNGVVKRRCQMALSNGIVKQRCQRCCQTALITGDGCPVALQSMSTVESFSASIVEGGVAVNRGFSR